MVVISFGKHNGKSVSTVYNTDKSYLEWCLKQPNIVQRHPQLVSAISICKNTDNLATKINDDRIKVNPGSQLNSVDGRAVICSRVKGTIYNNGDYGIKYGSYIDFPETTIRATMQNLNIAVGTIDKLFTLLKITGNNLNGSIAQYADMFFNKPEEFDKIKTSSVSEWEDTIKICLAWKYGIINDKFRTTAFEINSIQQLVIEMWKRGNSINTIITELTREKTPEEKKQKIQTPRKYCKKLPYLFTPAMYQFLLLGITNDEMKKIHKCVYDNVMGRVDYPSILERISELYRLDWKSEYYKFINNPYAFYTLTLERCDNVVIKSGRDTDNFIHDCARASEERHLGEISRFVYRNTKDHKWTATPDWLINKEHPDHVNHKDILRDNYGLFFDLELVYIQHIYREENQVASFISSNITQQSSCLEIKYIEDFTPTEEQDNSIRGALSRSTSIITGLAGTGKTTVIREIVRQIRRQTTKFIICSFTAKAVKRVKEVLGDLAYTRTEDNNEFICNAKTIHSVIHSIEKGAIERPDYLIIDEATMVSLSLSAKLLRLFNQKHVTLILLGDVNQLPPIKYGRPFEDIINSEAVQVHTLTSNRRVRGGVDDPIIVNSTNIVRSPFYTVQPANNFVIIDSRQIGYIEHIVLSNNITLNNIKDHKFITATNDDNTELNKLLSGLLNNRSTKESRNISCLTNRKDSNGNKITVEMKYSVGDPVIFTKNHVYPHVSNGCEGVIVGFSNGNIIVEANGYDISVPLNPRRGNPYVFTIKHMLLAYCITVHKAQGSQCKNVYYYIKGLPSKKFLNKRLTYTAITRAEEKCTVIEEPGLFSLCSRQQIGTHYGGLIRRIQPANRIISIDEYKQEKKDNNKDPNSNQLNVVTNMLSQLNINTADRIILC